VPIPASRAIYTVANTLPSCSGSALSIAQANIAGLEIPKENPSTPEAQNNQVELLAYPNKINDPTTQTMATRSTINLP